VKKIRRNSGSTLVPEGRSSYHRGFKRVPGGSLNYNNSGFSARRTKSSILVVLLLSAAAAIGFGTNGASAGTPIVPHSFSTTPAIQPSFNASVLDYVIRCNPATPVDVDVVVPTGWQGAINGGPKSLTNFSENVDLDYGESFNVSFLQLASGVGETYYVRCLPNNFPNFTSQKLGNPQVGYYVANPLYPGLVQPTTPVQTQYVILFNTDGVPVWWQGINEKTTNGTILPNGDMAYIRLGTGVIKEFKMTGELVRQFEENVDLHELILLPNGNYLIGKYREWPHEVDVSEWGGPTNGEIEDNVIMEVTPDGTLVWEWSAAEHIPISQTTDNWQTTVQNIGNQGGKGYDVYHWNSADVNGDNVVVSFRHLDAIYEFNKVTGAINWKLGGTTESYSLTPVNDAVFTSGGTSGGPGDFGGQHDARYYHDGTITLHDNSEGNPNTTLPGPPRLVRYSIDTDAMTATLVEEVTDSATPITGAFCCGSARKLPGGNWEAGWGFNNDVVEYAPGPAAARQMLISWTDANYFNYRAEVILPGVFTPQKLRSDMNAQFVLNQGP
jgi:Arylsulfotransferase (ASST)